MRANSLVTLPIPVVILSRSTLQRGAPFGMAETNAAERIRSEKLKFVNILLRIDGLKFLDLLYSFLHNARQRRAGRYI